MNTCTVIQGALQSQLLSTTPFAILRETGLVSQLRDELLSANARQLIKANLTRPVNQSPSTIQVDVLAVQQELHVLGQPDKEFIDLVLLRDGANLICDPGGPGDVISAVDVASVATAIEVKACPTVNGYQLLKVFGDVARLWNLAGLGIEAHMVLADKSDVSMFGCWSFSPSDQARLINWKAQGVNNPTALSGFVKAHTPSVQSLLPASLSKRNLRTSLPSGASPFVTLHVLGLSYPLFIY